jgi:hypothetical protein
MAMPLRLLILEDCPADADLMVYTLYQAGFAPSWQRVETEVDYLDSLHADLDVILREPSTTILPTVRSCSTRSQETDT